MEGRLAVGSVGPRGGAQVRLQLGVNPFYREPVKRL